MTKLQKPIRRVTQGTLGAAYGPDEGRPLVVELSPRGGGDLLVLKPLRTRRAETISLFDVYNYAIRARVNRALLERARERKETKARRLAAARQARAEKRLFNSV